jgi:hypothetical protein
MHGMTNEKPQKPPAPKRKGFASIEEKRKFLANPTRFPTDEEWEEMTPIEQSSFLMAMED